MSLIFHLILRLAGVVLLCLAGAVGWVLAATHRALEAETVATAERVARDLEDLYWQKLVWRDGFSRGAPLPVPEWETLRTGRLVTPGTCVTFAPDGQEPRRLCGQVEGVGMPAPAWFEAGYAGLFGPSAPVERRLSVRQPGAGQVVVAADPQTSVRQAWQQVSIVVRVAALMAAGIGLLAAALISQALMPARKIIAGLKRLEVGDYRHRLPGHRMAEFSHIARAVNELTDRLEQTTAERAALTKRLFAVQEEERRALARDLHDEFGQCLTATGALAAAIEAGAAGRPDLADDARAITRVVRRMMATVREVLARLRSQDVDELGLEASLAQLVGGWNAQAAPRAVFHLAVSGDLSAVPGQTALNIYRIAQECLTNAARHGRPSDVYLRVERTTTDGEAVALTVEDNGGGDAGRIAGTSGHGILGIRERIAALGGSLSIGTVAQGVRVAAIIPLLSPRAATPVAVGLA